ncbi:MAG TPA: hypothetical protein VFK35_02705 [Candidatus Limnocylindrales bacterium]|nr:hypothetical protein [Candidatus Limnocylindrales bacterium]
MSDLPMALPPDLAAALGRALDCERKIDRALEALGPVAGREVVVVGGGVEETRRLEAAGARLTGVASFAAGAAADLPAASADAIVCAWSGFRGFDPDEVAAADRVLRPGGRLLVVQDYGRDDVSRLRGDLPEYGAWSRRDGPYLANGFRMRVIHCFWTFATIEAAQAFLGAAFGPDGEALGAGLKRPRLSYNVAVYHRTRGGIAAESAGSAA